MHIFVFAWGALKQAEEENDFFFFNPFSSFFYLFKYLYFFTNKYVSFRFCVSLKTFCFFLSSFYNQCILFFFFHSILFFYIYIYSSFLLLSFLDKLRFGIFFYLIRSFLYTKTPKIKHIFF